MIVRFLETELAGAFIIELQPRVDERGFFARAWCTREFEAHGLQARMVQANLSANRSRGTLRGLHHQLAPFGEAKLVRCIRGAIYDVIVDLRPESRTHLKWIGVELTADNHRMLYVPEEFAHGFQSLVDDTEVFYQVSQFYTPEAERGIRWDDPVLGITWPHAEHRFVSEKDRAWPALSPAREAV
jgi:dTDP-4-dehydrorhamnose 3,5-epimerase